MAGELIGFVPPALIGAMLVWLGAPEVLLVAGLVIAGSAEGAVLGAFQARFIHDVFPDVTKWTSTTAVDDDATALENSPTKATETRKRTNSQQMRGSCSPSGRSTTRREP